MYIRSRLCLLSLQQLADYGAMTSKIATARDRSYSRCSWPSNTRFRAENILCHWLTFPWPCSCLINMQNCKHASAYNCMGLSSDWQTNLSGSVLYPSAQISTGPCSVHDISTVSQMSSKWVATTCTEPSFINCIPSKNHVSSINMPVADIQSTLYYARILTVRQWLATSAIGQTLSANLAIQQRCTWVNATSRPSISLSPFALRHYKSFQQPLSAIHEIMRLACIMLPSLHEIVDDQLLSTLCGNECVCPVSSVLAVCNQTLEPPNNVLWWLSSKLPKRMDRVSYLSHSRIIAMTSLAGSRLSASLDASKTEWHLSPELRLVSHPSNTWIDHPCKLCHDGTYTDKKCHNCRLYWNHSSTINMTATAWRDGLNVIPDRSIGKKDCAIFNIAYIAAKDLKKLRSQCTAMPKTLMRVGQIQVMIQE